MSRQSLYRSEPRKFDGVRCKDCGLRLLPEEIPFELCDECQLEAKDASRNVDVPSNDN